MVVKEIKIKEIKKSKLPLVIGYFGSVHVMHSQLLDKFHYRRYNILTFKDYKTKLKTQLYTYEERINNLTHFRPKNIFVFDINKHNMKAEDFIWEVLLPLQPSSILVGSDFRFGSDLKLHTILNQYFPVDTINHNKRVSTSIISKLLETKQIEKANAYLYTPYYYISRWVKGNKRGRKLGYRTINLVVDHKISVPEGSYVTKITIGKKTYQSVSFLGKSKTFNEREYFLETFVLKKHITPRTLVPKSIRSRVKVEFFKYLRPNTQFKREELLLQAIAKDVKTAKAFFGQNK